MQFIIRTIGLIVLALGFVGIVLDGMRSMANETVLFASLSDIGNALFPSAMAALSSGMENISPWSGAFSLWQTLVTHAMDLPASVVGFVLGALLLKTGQKADEPDLRLSPHRYN